MAFERDKALLKQFNLLEVLFDNPSNLLVHLRFSDRGQQVADVQRRKYFFSKNKRVKMIF